METSLRPTSASYEEITFLGCYLALKARKEKFEAFDFENYRIILSNVCEDCKRWIFISEEILKPLDLENEINNPRIENLINESGNEFIYASTGKIYDFGSKEIIPCNYRRYFLLVTFCLNNFNDDNVEKLLLHQLSIYHDKAEFLKKLKLNVREHAGELIAESKSKTVLEWISENAKHIDSQKNIEMDLSSSEQKEKESEFTVPPPKGFKIIPGLLTDVEIRKFFSFLYVEKRLDGNPYLSEVDVNELLKHGFGVGHQPSGKYYKLNITEYQIGLIKYCFYKLYKYHQGKTKIKEAIVKFLIFNFEQFKLEDGKDDLEYFKEFYKRFTGVKPATSRTPFDIFDYLPKK